MEDCGLVNTPFNDSVILSILLGWHTCEVNSRGIHKSDCQLEPGVVLYHFQSYLGEHNHSHI